jgi:DNA-binding SARP family transcriptional activator
MRPSFELKVFGGAVLLGPEGPVQGRAAHRRRLALLAILAGAPGRTVGRERILGYLWPDQPSDAGRHQLSEALYVLRKAIGEGAFVTAGDEVGLNPALVSTDLAAFRAAMAEERFRDAVEAYRGPFLDGFYVSEAPDFERWVEEERSSLAEACAAAREALAERCERAGDHAGAAGWWRRRAAHDPYSSRVALRLMNALAAAGERAGALKHAAAHAAFLREELGVDPDPEIGEAMQRLAAETAALPRLEPRSTIAEQQPLADPATAGAGEPSADELAVAAVPADDSEDVLPGVMESAAPRRAPAVWRQGSVVARSVGYVGAAMLGALLILAALRVYPGVSVSEGSAEALDIRRIAVLPFESSDDPELRMLANALTGAMIDRLSDVRSMRVVSRGGVLPYGGAWSFWTALRSGCGSERSSRAVSSDPGTCIGYPCSWSMETRASSSPAHRCRFER